VPAPRSFVALGLLTLLLAFAAVRPGLAPVVLALDALLVAAFVVDVYRARATPLTTSRVWPTLLVQGAASPLEVRFEAPRPIVLVAREALHPGLDQAPRRVRLQVPAGASSWTLPLVPRRRGTHAVGPLDVRVLGPWGLAWSQREALPPEERRVYPQVRWEGQVGRLLWLAQRRELGQSPLRVRGAGREPYGLREYQAGDPLSRIHWKATARHGRLISQEDAWERGQRLVVLLECGRAMASLDGSRSKLDHALGAILALTRVATGRGDRVSILAFSDRVERSVRVRPSDRSAAAAYESLYDLEARLAEPAYDVAVEALARTEPRRATVVLVTSLVDLAAAEGLREALGRLRRHQVLLVNLEDPELVALARRAPDTPAEAFAKVSALEILLGNRRLGQRLRRLGVRVTQSSADALTLRTLESYLRLVNPGRSRTSS
jgi:uncharacterized protein (DUF58 family)